MSWLLMYGLFLSPVLLLGAVMIADRVVTWPETRRPQDMAEQARLTPIEAICFPDRDLIESLPS